LTFSSKQFSFIKPANADPNIPPFTISVQNLGFDPKFVILYSGALTTTGDGQRNSIGFGTGSSAQRAIGWSSSDDAGTNGLNDPLTNAARIDSDTTIYRQISEGGGEHTTIQYTSHSASNGGEAIFTVTASTSGSYPIHGIAFGGTDITDVKVGTITTPTTTGNQDYNIAMDSPDMIFFMTTGAGATTNIFGNGGRVAFGAVSSNARRAAITTAARDELPTSDTGRKSHSAKAITMLDCVTNTTSTVLEADMTLKLSTGFRLNYTAVPSTQIPLFYLAVKGGSWDVGTQNSATSTGNQTITTQFQPKALMAFSTQVSSSNVVGTHSAFMLGSATTTSETGCIWYHDTDNVASSIVARSSSTTKLIRQLLATPVGADSTLEREATLSSFGATNFVVNWSTVTPASTVLIHYIIAGDTPVAGPTTIEESCIIKYNIRELISETAIAKYSMGGVVDVGPIQHTYDILGPVTETAIAKYDINSFISVTCVAKYHIANVTESCIAKYDIKNPISHSCTCVYDIEEHPSLNLRRYLKPLGLRIFIMSHDLKDTYHVYNSFDLHESSIRVEKCSVGLSINDAGDFSILVEDSGHGIDTSEVGEGNAVLIQAAKTVEDLGDGKHNVILGYITSKTVHRPATDVLKYEFNGAGSMIRFNERLTNISKSARRIKHDSPEPDTSDPNMLAWKLFRDILDTTDHLPIGGPRENTFTFKGVTDNAVDGFIASIEEELAEWSSPLDFIADSTGATWGVSYNPDVNDVFLKYATLEPSNIVIKGGSDVENPDDDKFNTAYIIDDWSFTDTRDKSQGFTNRFLARVGTKKVTANVIELTDIINDYTPLAVNDPPAGEGGGQQLPEGARAAFGPIIYLRSDIIGPNNSVWTTIANMAREFDLNLFYQVMKLGTGTDGPGPAIGQPDWITPWNNLVAARIRMLGWIDTQFGSKSTAAVREEIDRWVNTWGPFGIFFENVSAHSADHAYYQSIASYAKSKGIAIVVAYVRNAVPGESIFIACPDIGIVISPEWLGGLPNHETEVRQPWYSNQLIGRRAHFATAITPSVASDDDVAQWVSDMEFFDTGSYFYVTDDGNPQPFDTLSTRLRSSMFGAEAAAIRILQNGGFVVPGIPVQQDLAMSFNAETQNLGDIAVILSKVGNPIAEAGETASRVYLEILTDREVLTTVVDPITGNTSTVIKNMPNFTEAVAQAWIPFDRIQNQFPTVIFLHGLIKRKQDIQVGSRYWVVIYGRGQNEENTIRWHHANSEEQGEYLAARRIPAAYHARSETQRQQWQVFTKSTHPGFAFSYFKNTTHLLEASDSDSIDRFGLVESELDLTGIDDDAMASKAMHAILFYSAKPKRLYDIKSVTAPDDLILPGMLVRVFDDMTTTGQVAGSTASGTEAEIASASYEWDAFTDPMGCRYIQIDAIGHVDFAWAYWYAKYKRGEITVEFPNIVPKPPGPKPDENAPVVLAQPKGGIYTSAITVTFSTNKAGVKVFYTLNGTTPVITGAGTPSSENDTRVYIPGGGGGANQASISSLVTSSESTTESSSPIPINTTTTIKFLGMDAEGRKSTVYQEVYTMKAPTPPGGGKVMFMPYWKGPTLSNIQNVFNANMNSGLDYATYHKRIQESYDTSWASATLNTPSKIHEVEFEGYQDMVNNIDTAKAAGFDIIGFNGEEDESYPDVDKKDVVATHKKFSEYVRKKGLKVKFNPSPHYTKTYGSRIVKYCDFYNIQGQHVQGETEPFRNWIKQSVQSLKSNNANVFLTVTISADLKQHKSVKGQTRLQTMQNRWTYAKNYVDGVRVFYKTNDEVNNIISPFMQWFVGQGRNV